jgi:hypothetical protein
MQERCETGQTNLWLARKDYLDERRQYSRDGFTLMNGMFDSAVENRTSGPAHERHYTVNEIAEMWNLATTRSRRCSRMSQAFSPLALRKQGTGGRGLLCGSRKAYWSASTRNGLG